MAVQKPVLHDIARALSASLNVHDAALTVVEHAVTALRTAGGYVEYRVDRGDTSLHAPRAGDDAGGHVQVLAAVGEGAAPLGLRVPYPGSLTPASVRSGEPEVVTVVHGVGEHLSPHLPPCVTESGASCPGLIVPLVTEGHVQGALVLRRAPRDEPFTRADAAQARALGDLAAAALRRVALIEALRESEGRFQQIAEHIREFIWLSDVEFTTHYYVNVAYERIWGRPRASLYADPMSLLAGVHRDDRARVRAALLGMPRREYDIEYRVVRPDGEVRWVSSRGVPVRNERGEIWRIAGITEDITERQQAEIERRRLLERERAAREASEAARATAEQRRQELERVTESRTRLIRGFTHDIKNPLGAADGFLALLADGIYGELTAVQAQSVGTARRSIRSALDLIDQLLELARAEAGQLEIRRVATDVRAVASETAEQFRAQAEMAALTLTLELPPQSPEIESDPARVRQVLANLVSNAVKYTPRGGHITLRVGVRSEEVVVEAVPGPGEWIVIDVVDTGPGIARDRQGMLFQEFIRFDPSAAHGAGIGLAISQRVAGALGGAISVASEVGVGSTFSLWLPRHP